MVPYILISFGSAAAALIGESTNNAVGYIFLCMLAGSIYALIAIVVPLLHAREAALQNNVARWIALRRTSLLPLMAGLIALLPSLLALVRYPAYALHVFHIPAYGLHFLHL